MSKNQRPARWLLLAAHLGTITFMMACMVFTGVRQSADGPFRFDDGSIEIKDENGDWMVVSGTSFELVGLLENTDPWTVAGQEFETRESSMLDDGLEAGDIVRVRGIILEDETWVAYSIESTDEQTDPIIVIIGVVDSVDPWSVNGISLNVAGETDIQGDISVGMIVRVEILLLEDGTWEAVSIVPLGESSETAGCVTVIASILSVEGNEVRFLGWPTTVILEDDEQAKDSEENDKEGEDKDQAEVILSPDQVVLALVCISDNGQLIVVQIILLENAGDNGDVIGGEKVLVCHKPNKNAHTLSIAPAAVPAHLAHGDTLGPCP